MSYTQDDFITQAKLLGHSSDFISNTVEYANKLRDSKLPVIFSLAHLSKIVDVPYHSIVEIIDRREDFYKFYQIKKRRGGHRPIIVPHSNIRILQDYILKNILDAVDVHESAKGFVKDKSILTNALPHKNQPAILNIDLLKFFDSINEKRIYGIFKSLGYAKNLAYDFAKITTVPLPIEYLSTFSDKEEKAYNRLVKWGEAVLPQGAPTSPSLSNLVMRRLDKRLFKLSLKLDCQYTRYADDITFSGKLDNLPKIHLLRKIIKEEGFNINWKKVGIFKAGRRQEVTGLTVANDVHVHRFFKRDVKKHIYCCLKFGVTNHLNFLNLSDINFYKEWLLGKILFIKSIEPKIGYKLLEDYNKIEWYL